MVYVINVWWGRVRPRTRGEHTRYVVVIVYSPGQLLYGQSLYLLLVKRKKN